MLKQVLIAAAVFSISGSYSAIACEVSSPRLEFLGYNPKKTVLIVRETHLSSIDLSDQGFKEFANHVEFREINLRSGTTKLQSELKRKIVPLENIEPVDTAALGKQLIQAGAELEKEADQKSPKKRGSMRVLAGKEGKVAWPDGQTVIRSEIRPQAGDDVMGDVYLYAENGGKKQDLLKVGPASRSATEPFRLGQIVLTPKVAVVSFEKCGGIEYRTLPLSKLPRLKP